MLTSYIFNHKKLKEKAILLSIGQLQRHLEYFHEGGKNTDDEHNNTVMQCGKNILVFFLTEQLREMFHFWKHDHSLSF